ncbi:MAG: acyl-CoA dehydrogenase family protein [Acidimicrobiia bacterium]|nr:acyl-CoA dehydrogenase family protein [Acidimicrobiia bacterium]
MDFTFTDDFAEHRKAANDWVETHFRQEWIDEQRATGTHHEPELHALLACDGILGAGYPPEYGGTDVPVAFREAVTAALSTRGLLLDGWGSTHIVLRVILEVATEEQKQAIVPAALAGNVIIALGYTEPDSGSDVAAARTRAVRDGDEWVINGQKAFTSTAQAATHVFLLARTDPDKPKHRGLTLFLVPTDADGYDLQPIETLGGQRTNFTYYADVRVPDSARIGGVDEGWSVMRVALVHERGGNTLRGQGSATLAHRVARWVNEQRAAGRRFDPTVPERLARIAIDEEVSRLLALRVTWMYQTGGVPGVEGSMAKLFATEAYKRNKADVIDMLGPAGVLQRGAEGVALDGELEQEYRESIVETIRGGASEILRDLVAERRLGLPRSRP